MSDSVFPIQIRALLLIGCMISACGNYDVCGDGRVAPGVVCLDVEGAEHIHLGFGPGALAVADIDGDGWNDIVAASDGAGSLTVIWGRPGGPGRASTTWSIGWGVTGIIVADLDGDGRLDLATAAPGADAVGVLLGRGGRLFATPKLIAAGVRPQALVAADLDGRGSPEIVTANGDGTLTVFSEFVAGAPVVVGPGAKDLAVADFDGDGDIDIVVALAERNALQLMLGDGKGALLPGSLHIVGAAPFAVIAGDLDEDGVVDLASANSLDDTVSILFGDGNGGVERRATRKTARDPRDLCLASEGGRSVLYVRSLRDSKIQRISLDDAEEVTGAPPSFVSAIAAADLDGDLDDEILFGSLTTGEIGVLTPGSGIHFTPVWESGPVQAVFTVDLEDDDLDEIVAATDADDVKYEDKIHIEILRGDGTRITEVDVPEFGKQLQGARAADFTADGRRDVLIWGTEGIAVLVSRPDGSFLAESSMRLDLPGIADVAVGDADGDGDFEGIVALSSAPGRSRLDVVSFGNGDKPRVSSTTELTGTLTSVAPLDQDGNKRVDLVLLQDLVPAFLADVGDAGEPRFINDLGFSFVNSVLAGDKFIDGVVDAWMCTDTGIVHIRDLLRGVPEEVERLGQDPCDALAWMDLDDDGVDELIARRTARLNGSVRAILTPWLSAGDVWVQGGSQSISVESPGGVKFARIKEGAAVLVVLPGENFKALEVSLGPSFHATPLFTGVAEFDVIDLDNDHGLDLLGTGQGIGVALRNEDGAFVALQQDGLEPVFPGAEAVTDAVGADLDGDGRQDLLTTVRRKGEWRSDVAALTVAADGSMHTEHIVEVPYGDIELFVAHLDGDGVPDILLGAGRQPLKVASLLGRGGGDFAAPEWTEISTSIPAVNLQLVDVDHDERPDLVGQLAGGGVFIFAGLGGGRFQSQRLWSTLICFTSPTIGDFNDDGINDLACPGRDGLSIALGTTSGALGDPQVVLPGAQVMGSADLDGNGRLEIIAMSTDRPTEPEYSTMFVGRSVGDVFVFEEYAHPGAVPTSIDAVDMNDDGAPDLVLGGEGHISIVHRRP